MLPKLFAISGLAAIGRLMMADDTVAGGTGTGSAVTPPTPAPAVQPQPPAPNDNVLMQKQMFHFKKDVQRDDKGNVVKNPENGEPMLASNHPKGKHPSVELYLPVPKNERLIAFLTNTTEFSKEVELLRQAVFDIVYGVARGQVNDFRDKDLNATVNMSTLNFDKLDWTAIANMPKSERGAWAPSEEELAAFLASYKEVMPKATGKDIAVINNHVALFQGGFKKQRGQKEILELFANMLSIYIANAGEEAMDENVQTVEYFVNKLDRWLKTEEKITMDML